MKINVNWQQVVVAGIVSATLIYATHNRVPLLGYGVRRALG